VIPNNTYYSSATEKVINTYIFYCYDLKEVCVAEIKMFLLSLLVILTHTVREVPSLPSRLECPFSRSTDVFWYHSCCLSIIHKVIHEI
jgi:hypothetical protein